MSVVRRFLLSILLAFAATLSGTTVGCTDLSGPSGCSTGTCSQTPCCSGYTCKTGLGDITPTCYRN